MNNSTIKTFLTFIFIIIFTVFFIYSSNRKVSSNLEPFYIGPNGPSYSRDDLIINYGSYSYTANTQEIFINNTFKEQINYSNATIESISKDYIVNDNIYIGGDEGVHNNYDYFNYNILIGNKSIDIYLDKIRPFPFQFFYYYTGETPGVVRFFERDGSMQDNNKTHKAINSFVLINNTVNSTDNYINYIFDGDVLEYRPNVNYKIVKFVNSLNNTKSYTTDIQPHNEPITPNEPDLTQAPTLSPAPFIRPTPAPSPAPFIRSTPVPSPAPVYNYPTPSIIVPSPAPVYVAPTTPCTYGSWAPSGTASVTGCKTGTQLISRTATDGGKGDCTAPVSSSVPIGLIDTSQCPTCNYGTWTPSGTATVTGCKTGIQTISRTATDGGKGDCTAPVSSTVPVGLTDISQCPTCNYGAWTPSGTATVTGCQTGTQLITRTATDGGKGDCTQPISSTVPVGLSDNTLCPTTNMLCCYSMRLVVPTYTGPIMQLMPNTQYNNAFIDFYSDAQQTNLTTGPNNTGTPLSTWMTQTGATFVYVTKWYDQSGRGNHAINNNYSTDAPDTHPRIYLLNFTNGKSFYTLNWLPIYSTVLTLTTPINPNVISSTFYYSGAPGTIASNTTGDYEVRFHNNSTLSNQNGNEWYYSSSGTKYSYVNGVVTNTITANTWNNISLSVQTPYSQTIGQLGRDQGNNNLSINGYMFDFICYNKQLPNDSLVKYYNDSLILSSYIPKNAINTIIAQNTVGISGGGWSSAYNWNGYRVYKFDNNGSISFSGASNGNVQAFVFMCGGGGGGGLSGAGYPAKGGSGGGAGGSILIGNIYFQTGVTYNVTVGKGGSGSSGSGGAGWGGRSNIIGGMIFEEAAGGLNGYQNNQDYNSASGGYVAGKDHGWSTWYSALSYHPNSSEGSGNRGGGVMQGAGGGGGGAGGKGYNASNGVAGAGGPGYYFAWDQNQYFGSGGGGGAGAGWSPANGGTNAGAGAGQFQQGSPGTNGYGAGGGGGGSNEDNANHAGGNGGNGVVIIYVFS